MVPALPCLMRGRPSFNSVPSSRGGATRDRAAEHKGSRPRARASCKNEGTGRPTLSARIAIDLGPVVIDATGEIFGDVPNGHVGLRRSTVGLNQVPFLAGADAMIDPVVADIPNAEHGFTLIFAASPFPGHQYKLDWVPADEDGGNWYRSADQDMEGWL
jgi:hypothetical protein